MGLALLSLSHAGLMLWQWQRVAVTGVWPEMLPQGIRADIIQLSLPSVIPILLAPLLAWPGALGGLSPERTDRLRDRFNTFVRGLHGQGLYFRSLHLGNVVRTPDDRLGLIDISDIRVHRKALSPFWRARNPRRVEGSEGERDWLDREILLAPARSGAAPPAPW